MAWLIKHWAHIGEAVHAEALTHEVIALASAMEVQFDEHKLLVVYAHDLEQFEAVLLQAGVRRDDRMKLLTEGEHLHSSDAEQALGFERLACRVGVAEPAERVSW